MKISISEILQSLADDSKTLVTKDGKKAFTALLRREILPSLKSYLEPILAECAEQSKNETGWCKFRDKYFFNGLSIFTFWLLDAVLAKMEEAENNITA